MILKLTKNGTDIKAKARGYKTVPSKYKKKFVEMYGPLPEKETSLLKSLKQLESKEHIEGSWKRKDWLLGGLDIEKAINTHGREVEFTPFVTVGNTVKKGNKKMETINLQSKQV